MTKFLSKGNKSFIEDIKEKTYFFYPVKIDNEPIGYVVSIYNQNMIKKSADKEIMSVIFQTGSIAIFVIIASFLGTFFITGLIIRPIKELKDKLIGISTDDFQYKNILNKPLKKEKDKKCTKSISEECWIVAENPEKILENIGGLSIKECSKCEKFHSLAKDEIEELSFSFYMMTASLKDFLKKLEEAHKERETLNCMAAMGEMSAKIAHEVKNSLYAIGNAASYLKHSIDNEIVKEFSSVIKEEVNRLNEMTITFLNFSKLIEPNFKLNNLNTEIKRTLNLLKDDFEEENIKTITNLGEIPDFEFDKNMIKQVLFNLLLNSIDAIKEKGDKERYIKISTYQKEEKGQRFVILEIEDNGIGIKDEDKEKIFKPFFTTKQKGTGLGLPMVYKIIFSHKGIINMHSEYGKGTKFTIIFKI
ncbi:sensor histidine kinase [Hydrogenothermus marinus]|uniref:sensor histidine kinase n=1 Tax=Hydrogenothermus marinus TaxID=133270 RepID=UPI001FE52D35|nr:ATP-binding protein [Hydrogenothermus marinus]